MGPNMVYGLAKQFGLKPGTKMACDYLITSLDLLDHCYMGWRRGTSRSPAQGSSLSITSTWGGVDLLNSGEKNYTITTQVRKWYWTIYTWFLNVSMV
jgi:hypothetical protein